MQDWDRPVTFDLLSDRDDLWFYHHVTWMDMDGDGKKDALTGRASVGTGIAPHSTQYHHTNYTYCIYVYIEMLEMLHISEVSWP